MKLEFVRFKNEIIKLQNLNMEINTTVRLINQKTSFKLITQLIIILKEINNIQENHLIQLSEILKLTSKKEIEKQIIST